MGTHPIFESDFDCLTEMGNLFGKEQKPKKKSQVTDIDRAVLGLKKQRDQLRKTQLQIEAEETRTKERVRELLKASQKDKALKLLKRKRAIEKRYGQCEQNIENLEGLIETIKVTQEQQNVLKALDAGNVAMKELHKIVSVDDAERIMDEAAEQQAQVSEIDKLISTTITDADEVELDMLLGTVTSKDLPDIPVNLDVDLPSVPAGGDAVEPSAVTPTQETEMVAA